jgi:hypothetical protein
MALNSYANFQAAVADQLARTDLTNQIIDCITLFEAEASYELFRQRGTETRTILVPSNPSALTITGCSNNGSGLIRVTVASTTTLATSQIVSISQVGGTTEANGSWVITVIGATTFDLQNSVFTNTYTSGGIVQADQGFCTLPTDYLGWRHVTWTGSPTQDLEYVAPSIFVMEFPTWLPLVATDIPRVFTVEGNYLKIRPLDVTPLEFGYWAKTPALSSSLNWLFTNRVDAYWAGVLEQVYRYLKDYQQAAVYQQSKGIIYEQIKMQRFREPSNLRIRIDRSSYGATP